MCLLFRSDAAMHGKGWLLSYRAGPPQGSVCSQQAKEKKKKGEEGREFTLKVSVEDQPRDLKIQTVKLLQFFFFCVIVCRRKSMHTFQLKDSVLWLPFIHFGCTHFTCINWFTIFVSENVDIGTSAMRATTVQTAVLGVLLALVTLGLITTVIVTFWKTRSSKSNHSYHPPGQGETTT